MGIGKNLSRVDAVEKVTGEAKYTADLMPQNLLVGKVVRSTIANGVVKSRISSIRRRDIRGPWRRRIRILQTGRS